MKQVPGLLAATLMMCSLTVSGCLVVPVRRSTMTRTPAGRNQPSLQFNATIPGKSTRKEVEDAYGAFAINSGVPNLFWGQFLKSKWSVIWVAAGMGGSEHASGDRVWTKYDILVVFDENGVVSSSDLVSETRLAETLIAAQKRGIFPPLDLSKPIEIEGTSDWFEFPEKLQLSATELKVTIPELAYAKPDKSGKQKHAVTRSIRAALVRGIRIDPPSELKDPLLSVVLTLSQKTSLGTRTKINVEPSAALTLVRWLEQVKQVQPAHGD